MEERLLIQTGRLNLIKSMLSGIPICSLSLFRGPSLVCKSLEKYMRDFLWEGVDEGKGSHLVSWEVVGHSMNLVGQRLKVKAQ